MSRIEWTDATWNPVVGCAVVSPGCANCYAMRMARRIELMGTVPHYAGLTAPSKAGPVWTGEVALAAAETLQQPLSWRKPRRIFVNSMGDLFHEAVPDIWLDVVFAIMAKAPRHTFQVLTKRPERMRAYMTTRPNIAVTWPLPNVWLGVSAEDQTRADQRIPELLATPAAVRFVSYEPALGPIDFTRIRRQLAAESYMLFNALHARDSLNKGSVETRLDWIIAGGESGPGARPAHPDWFRRVRDDCAAAGVAFFFKQWGEYRLSSAVEWANDDGRHSHMLIAPDGRYGDTMADLVTKPRGTAWLRRVGKKIAGRELDGRTHDDMPPT